ncbi:MAG: hypothetical protein M1827_001370 [Pycnora praestabilis]|nr:MAG: hypothetical protein M1827_001370 [Pycnora praestabilis]
MSELSFVGADRLHYVVKCVTTTTQKDDIIKRLEDRAKQEHKDYLKICRIDPDDFPPAMITERALFEGSLCHVANDKDYAIYVIKYHFRCLIFCAMKKHLRFNIIGTADYYNKGILIAIKKDQCLLPIHRGVPGIELQLARAMVKRHTQRGPDGAEGGNATADGNQNVPTAEDIPGTGGGNNADADADAGGSNGATGRADGPFNPRNGRDGRNRRSPSPSARDRRDKGKGRADGKRPARGPAAPSANPGHWEPSRAEWGFGGVRR